MEIKEALAAALAGSDRKSRAKLCEECVETIYKFVKFQAPEGGGLDGRDGPEREALASVLDAAINAHYVARELPNDMPR